MFQYLGCAFWEKLQCSPSWLSKKTGLEAAKQWHQTWYFPWPINLHKRTLNYKWAIQCMCIDIDKCNIFDFKCKIFYLWLILNIMGCIFIRYCMQKTTLRRLSTFIWISLTLSKRMIRNMPKKAYQKVYIHCQRGTYPFNQMNLIIHFW